MALNTFFALTLSEEGGGTEQGGGEMAKKKLEGGRNRGKK